MKSSKDKKLKSKKNKTAAVKKAAKAPVNPETQPTA